MRTLAWVVLVCALPSHVAAQQDVRLRVVRPTTPTPCDGVRCSRHGECVSEAEQAYCFCDEGYRAEELRCVPAPIARRHAATVDGTRIVEVGLAERGHDLAGVGAGRTEPPGPLSAWVSGTLWCSDFVSWVYRVAGVPFTSGYGDGGGWHLTSNTTIRRWYQRREAWIDHESPQWSTFRPRPGDYVRIHSSTWGHSAIVRYVEGDTLHTIEGNASNRVIVTHYAHYRTHEHIDGFGMTTMADARIAATRAHEDDVTR
jgi:hypothetical protein